VTSFNGPRSGLAAWHSGWNNTDTAFFSQQKPMFRFDHDYRQLENWELWRNDGWITTGRKHYYAEQYYAAPHQNGLLILGGYSAMKEASGQIAWDSFSDGAYHAGVTSGFWQNNSSDNAYGIQPFVDESSNQKLISHNPDGTDTVFLFNRVKACKPTSTLCMTDVSLGKMGSSSDPNVPNTRAEYTRAFAAGFANTYVLHTDELPVKSGDKFTWTDNGETVEFQTYMDNYTESYVQLSTSGNNTSPYYFVGGPVVAEKFGYQLRLSVPQTDGYTLYPFLNILHAGSAATYTEITDTNGLEDVQGAMVENGTDRVVALFNSTNDTSTVFTSILSGNLAVYDSNRFTKAKAMSAFKQGSQVSFTTDDTKDIRVKIARLDPTKTWTVLKNGSAAGGTLTDDGVYYFTITGAAQTHTVSWSASGTLACTINSCSGCTTSGDCTGAGCEWTGTACQVVSSTCSTNTCGDCDEAECAVTSGCSWNGAVCAEEDLCPVSPSECLDQSTCEAANWCYENNLCIASCTVDPGPTSTITIYASEDTYLDQGADTTNRNGSGLSVISATGGGGGAVTVDPSTFTSGGANSATITTSSTRATHTSLADTHTAYLYKSIGTNYFGDFEIQFTARAETQQSNSSVGYLCLSDTTAATLTGMNTANDGLCFGFKRQGTDGWWLREYDSGSNTEAIVAGAAFETRYVTLTRSGSTCTANVYTNSSRTTHASGSPISISCGTNVKDYMYLVASGPSAGATSFGSGYIENVTIVSASGQSGSSGTDKTSLLKFDLSALASATEIVDVDLQMVTSGAPDGTSTLRVFKLLRDFNEAQATWNIYSTGNSFFTAGARGDTTDISGNWANSTGAYGSLSIGGAEIAGDVKTFTINQSLLDYVFANLGGEVNFAIHQNQNDNEGVSFYDSENATQANRPRLIIEYRGSVIEPPNFRPKRSLNGFRIKGRVGG
jgi:hypothetical protein